MQESSEFSDSNSKDSKDPMFASQLAVERRLTSSRESSKESSKESSRTI